MIGMILTLILGVGVTTITPTLEQNNIYYENNCITFDEVSEDLTRIQWHKNNDILDDETLSFFDKYYIDYQEALNSTDIYIQEEYIEFDEYISNYESEESYSINTLSLDEIETASLSAVSFSSSSTTQESEYTHNK